MRWSAFLLALALLFAGCTGETKSQDAEKKAAPNVSSSSGRDIQFAGFPLTAWTNLTFKGESGATLQLSFSPGPIPDIYGQNVTGHRLRVKYPTGADWTFGLGACMTPMWAARDGKVWFAESRGAAQFQAIPGFVLMRNGELKHTAGPGWKVSDMTQSRLNGTDFLVAFGTNRAELVTHWVWAPPSDVSTPGIQASWYHRFVEGQGFPGWIKVPGETEELRLEEVVAGGTTITACPTFLAAKDAVPRQTITKRATAESPALAWNLRDAIRYAESTPFLPKLQEFARLPGTAIYEWWGRPTGGSIMGEFRWILTYGNPDTRSALIVECTRSFAQEIPDVPAGTVTCSEVEAEQGGLRPLPRLDWETLTAVQYGPTFDTYRDWFGQEPCNLAFSFNPVYRSISREWRAVWMEIGCGAEKPTLIMDPLTGKIMDSEWFSTPRQFVPQ